MGKVYVKVINSIKYTAIPMSGTALIHGRWVSNPTEEMLINDGWLEEVKPVPTRTLKKAKKEKSDAIIAYDSSSSVNIFILGEKKMWLDKETRAGLKLRFEAESQAGKDITTLWYDGESYTMPITAATSILLQVEIYASACYDNTQMHLKNVAELTEIEAVDNYDITTNYPEICVFDIG